MVLYPYGNPEMANHTRIEGSHTHTQRILLFPQSFSRAGLEVIYSLLISKLGVALLSSNDTFMRSIAQQRNEAPQRTQTDSRIFTLCKAQQAVCYAVRRGKRECAL